MSQKAILYQGLKTLLSTVSVARADTGKVMRFQKIELWRNNLDREKQEQAFLYPACFIEFVPSNYMELSNGLQSYLTTRLHICFESYKDEDTEILELVDATYHKVQGSQFGYFAKMKRRSEEQNFDHDNVQDYIQDYDCGKAKEYPVSKLVPANMTEIEIDVEITPTPPPIIYSHLLLENGGFLLQESGNKIRI